MEHQTLTQRPSPAEPNGEINMILNNFDAFTDLDISNYDWKCHVRVQSIWKGISREKQEFYGINVVFIDDTNSKIHAFMNKQVSEKFEKELVEGGLYMLSNFRVKEYAGDETHRAVRNPKHIYFTAFTVLEKLEHPCLEIEMFAFDFSAFEEIEKIANDNRFLIDIVGIVRNKRPFISDVKDGKEHLRLKFDITDGKSAVRVTFFNDMARLCDNALLEDYQNNTVIAISSGKVAQYHGKVYISNYPATRFYINPKHYCVAQLKDRYEKLSTVDISSPEEEEIFPKFGVKQITELRADFLQKQVCCDVVLKKVDEKSGWFYKKCTRCLQEVVKKGTKFECPDCKRIIPYPDRRFRVFTICADNSGSLAIVVPDSEIRHLTGKTVLDLLGDDDDDVEELPLPNILKHLKNKHYTVTLLISANNIKNGSTVYTATQLRNGKEISGNHSPSQPAVIESEQLSMLNTTNADELMSGTPHTGKSSNKVRPRETTTPLTYDDDHTDGTRVVKNVKKEHV